ncbi:MAG: hypothetical protein H6Q69_3630 [Firmicutes bacterium]|nr:hypothetical protein [Bacillota bacterium]
MSCFSEMSNHCSCECSCEHQNKQTHVHEFLGSTKLAEQGEDRHNHRFAGVTGEARFVPGGGHFHEIWTNTDFFENHFHELRKIQTGLAIEVGAGKHVHFVQDMTTVNDDHCHNFVFATLIECPISTRCK